jgi:hypothetical protein
MKILASKAASALCALMLLTIVASAQYRAGVQGAVTDQSGVHVPEASIKVTNIETNISRTATTSNRGVFSVPGLAPGHYRITVEKQGFATATLEDEVVDAEQMRAVNMQMRDRRKSTAVLTLLVRIVGRINK